MNSPQLALPLPEPAAVTFAPVCASDVVWIYDVSSGALGGVAGPFADLFGRPESAAHAPLDTGWPTWIHADDREAASAGFAADLLAGRYNQTYRLVLPDGSLRWLHDRALNMGDGRLLRMTSDVSAQRQLNAALEAARWRNEVLVEHGVDVVIVLDRDNRVREVSGAYQRVLGYAPETILGTSSIEGVDPAQHDEWRAQFAHLGSDPGGSIAMQYRVRHADGHWVWVEGTARNLRDDPHVGGIVINCRDITRRKQAELALTALTGELEARVEERTRQLASANRRLRDADRLQRLVMQALPDVLLRCDRESTILDVSGAALQMIAPAQELIGTRLVDRPELPDAVRTLWLQTLQHALDQGRNQICEYRLESSSGGKEFEARVTPIGVDEAIAIVRDVTERNRLRERLQHLATHDELTGLLNRSALRERLRERIARHPNQPVTVLVIDLDRFKQVNDTLGHAIGDTLLKVVANRITRRAGPQALCARIGGDEFALFMPGTTASDEHSRIELFTQTLIADLGNRMRLHGDSLYVTPSVGVCVYPADGLDADVLLRNADVAMMRAKERGRNDLCFYSADLTNEVHERFNTEHSLRKALDEGELSCLYQPKISVTTGSVVGVEALVRWNTADGQVLVPARFIPLAERTGLIRPLGRWVLREAMRQVGHFPTLGRPAVDLAINVSVSQLRDTNFPLEIREALAEFAFPAERLTLEIAETAFVEDMQVAADVLGEIASLGVRISIDDFGTGYGGLSWLKNLPVHEIKIDRSFIKGCAIDAFDANIVSGLVDIAHNLGIQIVAEGVERADQIAFLTQVKCDVIQGYFIGMPMSALELVRATKLWQST